MLTIVICALMCFVISIWWRQKYNHNVPPTHPGALPIIGNAHQLLGNSTKMWEYLKEISYFSLKCGGVSTVYLGPLNRIFILTDPDDCLTVSNACLDKPFIYDIAKDWVGNGLITADVSTWKPHRKFLNPVFSQTMLNKNLEIFNIHARHLIERISSETGKEKFDSRRYFMSYAQESICQIILDLEGKHFADMISDFGNAVLDSLEVFIAKTQKLWLHIPFIFERSAYKKKLDNSTRTSAKIINQLIEKHKCELTKNNFEFDAEKTESLLNSMLRLQESQGIFTDNEIREHLETMMFTGFDTITETLTFGMKLIGLNERVQQRIYEELQEVFGDKIVEISRYDLNQLIYLDAVVKEILRIYTTVPLAARLIHKDIKLKNYTLPAGSIGVLSGFGIHRHPMWGSDVEDFRPERWLESSSPVNDNPNFFAAFSLGKRNCIGKWFALASIKTAIAYLLSNYRVLADDLKMTVKFDVSIRSTTGHEISLQKT